MDDFLGCLNYLILHLRLIEIIEHENKYFEEKSKKFNEFLAGRTIREAILELEDKIEEENKNNRIPLRINHNIESEKILKNKIKKLPEDKIPIIIAGGSFNAKNRVTQTTEAGIQMLEELIQKIDNKKVYFVIGHKMEGYEKAIIDISKKLHKKFEVCAIIPKMISTEEANKLMDTAITGIRITIKCNNY